MFSATSSITSNRQATQVNGSTLAPTNFKKAGKFALKVTFIALTALAIGTGIAGLVVGLGLTFGAALPIGLGVTAVVLMLALAILKLKSYAQKNSSSRQTLENDANNWNSGKSAKPVYNLDNIDTTKLNRNEKNDHEEFDKFMKLFKEDDFNTNNVKEQTTKVEEQTTWNQIPDAKKHIASQ